MNATQDPLRTNLPDEIEKIAALVAAARKHVADGRMIDLAALEGRVDSVCAEIKRSRPADGASIRSALETLMSDLDRLESALTTQFDALTHRDDAPTPHKAATAYGLRR